MSKPKIFLFCHAMAASSDVMGYALAEDGECLASHWSSSPGFSQHDLGYTSDWQHENYKTHYPNGFDLEWINEDALDTHEGYQKAIAFNRELARVSGGAEDAGHAIA